MGRPFAGNVSNKKGVEDHVVLRRSIFRQIKNLYGREDYSCILGS